jgi:hypothetical protein
MIIVKIPVYITLGVKKPKTILLSLNWYRNAHHHTSNKVKHLIEEQILSQIPSDSKPMKEYQVTYVYYYKSKVSDLPNVCALASKYLNDALKSIKLIPDDNVQYLLAETYCVGGQLKEDPHILACISEHHAINHIDPHNFE